MGAALRYLDKKPIRGWRFLGFRSGFFLAYQSAGAQFFFRKAGRGPG
jgi:hypothetical protein